MNPEVTKAMNKKETKIDRLGKWWCRNGYKVNRVVFFPIWVAIRVKEKLSGWRYNHLEWSEERTNEILSYYIPRRAEWDAEEKCFYFADNGMGWSMKCHQKKLKMKDRAWCRKFGFSLWGGKIRTHLIEKFELEGFEKEVGDTNDGWTEITFKMIEN
jgi:hypothetical protein